jgi:hypothetical protein
MHRRLSQSSRETSDCWHFGNLRRWLRLPLGSLSQPPAAPQTHPRASQASSVPWVRPGCPQPWGPPSDTMFLKPLTTMLSTIASLNAANTGPGTYAAQETSPATSGEQVATTAQRPLRRVLRATKVRLRRPAAPPTCPHDALEPSGPPRTTLEWAGSPGGGAEPLSPHGGPMQPASLAQDDGSPAAPGSTLGPKARCAGNRQSDTGRAADHAEHSP